MKQVTEKSSEGFVRTVKLSAMIVASLWSLIYRLSEESARLPEFVYVNF